MQGYENSKPRGCFLVLATKQSYKSYFDQLENYQQIQQSKKQNSISEKITLLLVDIQLILPQSIENKS
jgi:hypothetical protein